MINVVDRVPTIPHRIKLTSEKDGSIAYYTLERADEPSVEGTPINAALFNSIASDISSVKCNVSTRSIPSNSWNSKGIAMFPVEGYNKDTMVCSISPSDYESQKVWGECGIWAADSSLAGLIYLQANEGNPDTNINVIVSISLKGN